MERLKPFKLKLEPLKADPSHCRSLLTFPLEKQTNIQDYTCFAHAINLDNQISTSDYNFSGKRSNMMEILITKSVYQNTFEASKEGKKASGHINLL